MKPSMDDLPEVTRKVIETTFNDFVRMGLLMEDERKSSEIGVLITICEGTWELDIMTGEFVG